MIGPYQTFVNVPGPCDRCDRMIERVVVGCPICDQAAKPARKLPSALEQARARGNAADALAERRQRNRERALRRISDEQRRIQAARAARELVEVARDMRLVRAR